MRSLRFFAFSSLFFAICAAASAGDSAVEKRVKCPDGQSFCPGGTTCCQMDDAGQYGCCPLPDAVCCSDHLHCCPESTQCDLQHQTCLQKGGGGRSHPLYRKFPASSRAGKLIEERERPNPDVICPDQTSKCPPHTTCCPLNGGRGRRSSEFWRRPAEESQSTLYGCCPAEQAVCCADHMHCCPHGTQCDTAEGKCISAAGGQFRQSSSSSSSSASNDDSDATIAPMRKLPATKLARRKPAQETEPAVHLCGDIAVAKGGKLRVSACERDEKCCRYRDEAGEKATGCCPFRDGQCCAHSGHCCPAGFACDRDQDRCVSEQNGITLSTKMFSLDDALKKRLHGGPKPTECADATFCSAPTDICCARRTVAGTNEKTARTEYDCCPLDKGICCAGQRGCCPAGYKCSEGGGCERLSVREQIVNLMLDRN